MMMSLRVATLKTSDIQRKTRGRSTPSTPSTPSTLSSPRAPRTYAVHPWDGAEGASVRIHDTTTLPKFYYNAADSAPYVHHQMQHALKKSITGAALIAALLLVPAHQASAGASGPGVGCVKCDEKNAASLLVELQEQELPALQANVSKIRDPKMGSLVESKLAAIETEVAMLAENEAKMPPSGLAKSANRVISEIAALKREMRAHE